MDIFCLFILYVRTDIADFVLLSFTGANLIIRERKLLPNPVPEFVSVIGSYLKGSFWIY